MDDGATSTDSDDEAKSKYMSRYQKTDPTKRSANVSSDDEMDMSKSLKTDPTQTSANVSSEKCYPKCGCQDPEKPIFKIEDEKSWNDELKKAIQKYIDTDEKVMGRPLTITADGVIDDACEAIKEKAKAICRVLCKVHVGDKKYECGTGSLCDIGKGWTVITNYHIIGPNAKPEDITVEFGYDTQGATPTTYHVKSVEIYSPKPSKESEDGDIEHVDKDKLDYAVLVLKIDDSNREYLPSMLSVVKKPLNNKGSPYLTKLQGSLPVVQISHPHGKPKHISIGVHPEGESGRDVAHVVHQVLSDHGSSGAPLLYCCLTEHTFTMWRAGFLNRRFDKGSSARL